MLAQHKVSEARGYCTRVANLCTLQGAMGEKSECKTPRCRPQLKYRSFNASSDSDERDRHIEESRVMAGTICKVGVELDPRGR
jgi:hypothetical protein